MFLFNESGSAYFADREITVRQLPRGRLQSASPGKKGFKKNKNVCFPEKQPKQIP